MRVLVCGGRNFFNKKLLYQTLDALCEEFNLKSEPSEDGNWLPRDITIINGKAAGADTLASDWAIINWVPFEEYPADWQTHGKAAGPIRNKQMLEKGRPDLILAFPGGRGTAHMVRIARRAGVEVREING